MRKGVNNLADGRKKRYFKQGNQLASKSRRAAIPVPKYEWEYMTDAMWDGLKESGAIGDSRGGSIKLRWINHAPITEFRKRLFYEMLCWVAKRGLKFEAAREKVEALGEKFAALQQHYYANAGSVQRAVGAMQVLGMDGEVCGQIDRMVNETRTRSIENRAARKNKGTGKGQKAKHGGDWRDFDNWDGLKQADGDPFYAKRSELCQETLDWCEKHLVIGDGVGWVGEAFRWMPWYRDFIEQSYAPGIHECGLSVARKNGKTAGLAAWILGCMLGPIRYRGFSCLVASERQNKADVFAGYVAAMAVESGLMHRDRKERGKFHDDLGIDGFQVISTKSDSGEPLIQAWHVATNILWGELRVKAYSKTVGDAHRASFIVIDEGGRLGVEGTTPYEGHRMAWNTLESSMGAGGDHFMVVSAEYNGAMFRQMRERYEGGDEKSLYFKRYSTPEHYALDDREGWRAANPSMDEGVKSEMEMERKCKRAMLDEMDERDFREQELNQPQGNALNQMVSEAVWKSCVYGSVEDMLTEKGVDSVDKLRVGGCFVGFDFGSDRSMNAMVVLWYGSGFCEAYGAFPGLMVHKGSGKHVGFPLLERGARDGVGDLYSRMENIGELRMYEADMDIPRADFLREVWEGRMGLGKNALLTRTEHRIIKVAMDKYKFVDYRQAVNTWRPDNYGQWNNVALRGTSADKQDDINRCKRIIHAGKLFTCVGHGGMLLTHSLRNTTVEHKSDHWRIRRTVDGTNDAAVALTNVAGCFIFQENRDEMLMAQSKKTGGGLKLAVIGGGYG